MLKHIYLIFFSTFVLGLILGSLLFFSNVGTDDSPIDEPSSGYTIAVYMYGGCEELGCPLYRVTQTGEYIYIGSNTEQGGERHTGTLPLSDRRALDDQLKDAELSVVEQSVFSGECPVYVDGAGYRYDIAYDGARYSIDSCEHATNDILLFRTLTDYFETLSE